MSGSASANPVQHHHNVFVYGSLLADDVVKVLLKRVPPSSSAILHSLLVSLSLSHFLNQALDWSFLLLLSSFYTNPTYKKKKRKKKKQKPILFEPIVFQSFIIIFIFSRPSSALW